jgi:hypothetical protein
MMKKGSIKVFGKFVHPENDFVCKAGGWTVWRRGDVCVARETDSVGVEGRCQLSDHGAGRKSFQVFGESGQLLADIDTKF